MQKIVIDPLSRIEGHLKVEALVDSGVVKEASVGGTLFRGFEIFLKGRDPWDAVRLTERVCGVCPASHGMASAQNLDCALGVTSLVPHNARLIRNLILGANFLQSHILHFYALAALDFVDVTAVADYAGNDPDPQAVKSFIDRGALAPFVPRFGWLARIPAAIAVGYAAGQELIAAVQAKLFPQLLDTVTVFSGAGSARGVIDALLILVGTLSVVFYFTMTFRRTPVLNGVSRVGVIFLMVGFGAVYGNMVMSRFTLLIGRIEFLFGEWIHLIPS